MSKIATAQINFNESGNPISEKFDDIYFSLENGLAESEYVFQQGNTIPERWSQFDDNQFVAAETGFGTGLNFLALCQTFAHFKQTNPQATLQRLHFISFEKYPIEKQALIKALKQWPSVSPYAEALINQYPSLIAGPHRLAITADISLDLWLGDIAEQIPQLSKRANGIIDAWFLDGFAPSKNPDMWNQTLFDEMARLAKPHCTVATFTAAGFVRRGLMAAGFAMKKQKGFGRKREMIAGALMSPTAHQAYLSQLKAAEESQSASVKAANPQTSYYQAAPSKTAQQENLHPYLGQSNNSNKQVTIIGGGIAAACSAVALAKRGFNIKLHCKGTLADAASGNRQGALYPLLQLNHNTLSEFYAKAFEYAMRFYQQQQSLFDFAFDDCGVLQMAFNADRIKRLKSGDDNAIWPSSLVHSVTAEQANHIASINIDSPAWYFPTGGWLNPVSFVKAQIAQLITQGSLELVEHSELIQQQQQTDLSWQIKLKQHEQIITETTPLLLLCTGFETQNLIPNDNLQLQPVRGQVSHLATDDNLNPLKTVICHKGYLTPNWQDLHCAGASFLKDHTNTENTEEEDQQNIDQQMQFLAQSGIEFDTTKIQSSRASIRSKTLDHLPIAGNSFEQIQLNQQFTDLWKGQAIRQQAKIKPNLYLLTGLGSRGLSSAPLLAELIAATINHEPLPFAIETLTQLQPNRFLLKKIKRRESE